MERRVTVPFYVPTVTGREKGYLEEVLSSGKFSGDGPWSDRCNEWLQRQFNSPRALVTTSGTAALEIAALLCDLAPGDEVILPSFAFCSAGNAFIGAGASLVFVDVDPVTMNIDPDAVERAVTPKTRAIVAVDYAGVSCNISALQSIAQQHSLILVEDAAQAMFSSYKGKPVGAHATVSCISFHESKNIHCGEGGALVVNDEEYVRRAEIILEKGTNRMEFKRGHLEKYTWVDIGSSYALSELNAAFLMAQLEDGPSITQERLDIWEHYRAELDFLVEAGRIEAPKSMHRSEHNGHIFWIKLRNGEERRKLIDHLQRKGITASFHFVPLHSSPAGRRFGRFSGEDRYTTADADRLLRLPIYHGLTDYDLVIQSIADYLG